MSTQFDNKNNDGEATLDSTTGLWNSIMHKQERIGVTIRKFINLCNSTFKDFDEELLLSIVWDKGYKSLVKHNIKNGRKEQKKKAIYASTTLSKPPRSGYIIFNKEHSAKCKKNDTKYVKTDVEKQWQNMSEDEKDVYRNKAKKLHEEYQNNLQKEKEQAIEDGTFPADKPKRPVNEWILFRTEIYSEVAEKHKPTKAEISNMNDNELSTYKKEVQKKIQSEIKERWDNLSQKQRDKYFKLKTERQKKYLLDMEKWQVKEYERLEKIRESEDDSKKSLHITKKNEETSELLTTKSLDVDTTDSEQSSLNSSLSDQNDVQRTEISVLESVEEETSLVGEQETVTKSTAKKDKKKVKDTKAKTTKVENKSPVKKTGAAKKPVKKRVITVASETDTSDSESASE
jgi:hypothetical protein